jgi:hypothetical protein
MTCLFVVGAKVKSWVNADRWGFEVSRRWQKDVPSRSTVEELCRVRPDDFGFVLGLRVSLCLPGDGMRLWLCTAKRDSMGSGQKWQESAAVEVG